MILGSFLKTYCSFVQDLKILCKSHPGRCENSFFSSSTWSILSELLNFHQSTLVLIQNFIPWHSNCSDHIKCNSTPTETHLRPSPSVIQRFFFGMLQEVTHFHSDAQQWIRFGDFFSELLVALQLSKLVWYVCVSNLTCPLFLHRFAFDKLTEFWQTYSPKLPYSAYHPIQNVSSQKIPLQLVLLVIIYRIFQPQCHVCRIFLFYFSCKNVCHLKYYLLKPLDRNTKILITSWGKKGKRYLQRKVGHPLLLHV